MTVQLLTSVAQSDPRLAHTGLRDVPAVLPRPRQARCEGAFSLGAVVRVKAHIASAQLPDKLSFDQGAGLPSAVSTAGIGLYHTDTGPRFSPPWKGGRGKYAGTPIVVIGGASVVGSVGAWHLYSTHAASS